MGVERRSDVGSERGGSRAHRAGAAAGPRVRVALPPQVATPTCVPPTNRGLIFGKLDGRENLAPAHKPPQEEVSRRRQRPEHNLQATPHRMVHPQPTRRLHGIQLCCCSADKSTHECRRTHRRDQGDALQLLIQLRGCQHRRRVPSGHLLTQRVQRLRWLSAEAREGEVGSGAGAVETPAHLAAAAADTARDGSWGAAQEAPPHLRLLGQQATLLQHRHVGCEEGLDCRARAAESSSARRRQAASIGGSGGGKAHRSSARGWLQESLAARRWAGACCSSSTIGRDQFMSQTRVLHRCS